MLAGPRGIGKRAAAAWMAAQKLGIEPLHAVTQYPSERPEHADLHWIDKLEDKKTIIIEQVRDLVYDLSLTSYEGRGKVAVIEPADIMTVAAANSLYTAVSDDAAREAAVITFVVTASGLTLFGIGAAFWGLVAGVISYFVFTKIKT